MDALVPCGLNQHPTRCQNPLIDYLDQVDFSQSYKYYQVCPHKIFGHITTDFSFFLVDRSTVVTLHFQLFFLENSGHKKRDRNSTYQSLGICIIKAATVRTKTLSQVNVIKSVSRQTTYLFTRKILGRLLNV